LLFEATDDFSAVNTEYIVNQYVTKRQIGFGKVGMPLRLALIGAGKGPHIFDVIEIIGKQETINRIKKLPYI
jgi:glutamyl-tRNA synthetase